MLADRFYDLQDAKADQTEHWTARQLSNEALYRELSLIRKNEPDKFSSIQNRIDREDAWDDFREYAYQWY